MESRSTRSTDDRDSADEYDIGSENSLYQRQLRMAENREALRRSQTAPMSASTSSRAGLLDDLDDMPVDIREYIVADLPLDEDVIGYMRSFREGQERYPDNIVASPFGQVMSLSENGATAGSLFAAALAPAPATDTVACPVTPNGPLIKASETAKLDADGTYSITLQDGSLRPAVLFSEVYQSDETKNETRRPPSHERWTETRGAGRPEILYTLEPDQRFKDRRAKANEEQRMKHSELVFEPWLDPAGQVIVSEKLKPLRFFPVLPETFSTDVPGWYLETLFRIDPVAKHDDILDRMPSTNPDVTRPSASAPHQRRARARHVMRITNWNAKVEDDDFWEVVIKEDLDDWARANNSTARLRDLRSDQIALFEALQRNPKVTDRSDKEAHLKGFRSAVVRAKAAGYPDGHRFITDVEKRIEVWEKL